MKRPKNTSTPAEAEAITPFGAVQVNLITFGILFFVYANPFVMSSAAYLSTLSGAALPASAPAPNQVDLSALSG